MDICRRYRDIDARKFDPCIDACQYGVFPKAGCIPPEKLDGWVLRVDEHDVVQRLQFFILGELDADIEAARRR